MKRLESLAKARRTLQEKYQRKSASRHNTENENALPPIPQPNINHSNRGNTSNSAMDETDNGDDGMAYPYSDDDSGNDSDDNMHRPIPKPRPHSLKRRRATTNESDDEPEILHKRQAPNTDKNTFLNGVWSTMADFSSNTVRMVVATGVASFLYAIITSLSPKALQPNAATMRETGIGFNQQPVSSPPSTDQKVNGEWLKPY